jgi:probable HAF family extracellular repeat protein
MWKSEWKWRIEIMLTALALGILLVQSLQAGSGLCFAGEQGSHRPNKRRREEMNMKYGYWVYYTAITLFVALAVPFRVAAQGQNANHVRYTVTDLGPAADQVGGINNRGSLNYTAVQPDGSLRATFRQKGRKTDLGTLGGPNSSAFAGPSESGQVVGKAETSTPDPLGEDYCFYGTNLMCRGFVWQNGQMTPLTTLGGNNSWANDINNRGQIVGQAENSTQDSTCSPPQVLQNPPVIWDHGQIRALPTIGGDPDGGAFAINDNGEVVGATANCTTPFHAVLWRKDGSVIDLGNLGGTMNNVAQDINSRGQVVGFSDLSGDAAGHAFLWTENSGMQDLGTLPGGSGSFAFSINEKGQVVGGSTDANGDLLAFLWQDGIMTDLNTLIPSSFPYVLVEGYDINARGEILGFAVDPNTDEEHAFLAVPCDEQHANGKGCQDAAATSTEALASARQRNLNGTLCMAAKMPGRQAMVSHSGEGPIAKLTPTGMQFLCDFHRSGGCQLTPKMATLTNIGRSTLNISSITIMGGPFSETNTCPARLGPGQSCTITVAAHPGSTYSSSDVNVHDNAPGSPQSIDLTFYEY